MRRMPGVSIVTVTSSGAYSVVTFHEDCWERAARTHVERQVGGDVDEAPCAVCRRAVCRRAGCRRATLALLCAAAPTLIAGPPPTPAVLQETLSGLLHGVHLRLESTLLSSICCRDW